MDIGSEIREMRKSKRMSQIEVAKAAGIAVNSLRLYESNKRQPRLEQLQAIAAALGTTINWLLPPDNYWQDADGVGHSEPQYKFPGPDDPSEDLRRRLEEAYDDLNPVGQEKAVERLEELAEIPKYQKETQPTEDD